MKQEVIDRFIELVRDEKIVSRLLSCPTMNIRFSTLGGPVFWNDLASINGWRLQQNSIFGNCRILNPQNERLAWGSEAQIEELLYGRPHSFISSYFEVGYTFAHYPRMGQKNYGKLILIHGLLHRGYVLAKTAKTFANMGYDVYVFDYPTSKCSIDEHATIFLEKYRTLVTTFDANEKIRFLTHSMGAIVLRMALAKIQDAEQKRISHIVMLAPPNKGSDWATFLSYIPLVSFFNRSLPDLSADKTSPLHRIPFHNESIAFGVIIAKRDIKVAREYTKLDTKNCQYTEIDCHHSIIMRHVTMYPLAHHFFTTGGF